MGISQQPLIRKHSYLGQGTLEGLLTFHEFWPQGGAGGENLGHPKKVLYCFFFYDYPFLTLLTLLLKYR